MVSSDCITTIQGSHRSRSKINVVNFKGHVGLGQPKGHYIGRWAHINVLFRVGPDSPFALLSPVLGSEIPFEKGSLKNPFSPTRNNTLCPVLGIHGPFAKLSISFIHVFCKTFIRNLIGNYYLVKFPALRANFSTTKTFNSVSRTVS